MCSRAFRPAVFAICLSTGVAVPGRPPDDAGYYEPIAQIIPTIVVALAVESRAGWTWRSLNAVAFSWLMFGSLVLAELAAIFSASS